MRAKTSTRLASASSLVVVLGAAAPLAGCGGGVPLLHPARTLPQGEVRAAAGFSANVAAGSVADDLRAAKDEAVQNPNVPGAPGSDPTYAKGALVAAAVAPGVAPFVSARVGIGHSSEGGLAYTGRGARIDLRRSFDAGAFSFSAGIGGDFVLLGRGADATLPNVDLASLHGYGLDVPLLVGWTSDNQLYTLWAGARGGWDHVNIDLVRTEPKPQSLEPITLTADRVWAGAVAGLAIGFRHVHAALELDVAYQSISGSYNQTDAKVAGVTLAPATALWWTF